MKYTIIIAFILLAGCRQEVQQIPPEITGLTSTLFDQLKSRLDYSTLTKVIGKENVEIFLIKVKGDTNTVYATSAKGELLFERHIVDANNGYVDITKNGETARMEFKNGTRSISARMAGNFHGGSGFCQREGKESFGECFKAESDEFCDSFISCIALATQPQVAIIIGIACSCKA